MSSQLKIFPLLFLIASTGVSAMRIPLPVEVEEAIAILVPQPAAQNCALGIAANGATKSDARLSIGQLIDELTSVPASPLPLFTHQDPEPFPDTIAAKIYARAKWSGKKPPWTSFRAFFELEDGNVRREIHLVDDASSVSINSTYQAYLLSGREEHNHRIDLPLSANDYLRSVKGMNPHVFMTNRLAPSDVELMAQSLVVGHDGQLHDVREVLEIRIHYRNGGNVKTKIVEKEVGPESASFPLTTRLGTVAPVRLAWRLIEYWLGLDKVTSYARLIKRQVDFIRAAGSEVLLIEIAHTHPFPSHWVTFDTFPVDDYRHVQVIDPMLSKNDKRAFAEVQEEGKFDVPFALTVVSGLTDETLCKEYMILY